MKQKFVPVILTAAVTSFITFWGFSQLSKKEFFLPATGIPPVHYTADNGQVATQPVDFSPAAEAALPSVVHVKTLTQGKTVMAQDPFGFWGPQQYRTPDQMGAGSGVIISEDGYIVTNNHVVQGADKVQVTFNDRNTQIAKVVGSDAATDLAVLKIEGNNFPYVTLGNSDQVKLGQWVLAIGYPLNLDATVTAGIVSAKSRSIGINQRNADRGAAIESFIQTDAAVNPGNSGGALINTQGQLIGINSAIASPTGTYAGYSYAIPSNLVQKVATDIIQYGKVKRGFLGAELLDLNNINPQQAEQLGISSDDFQNSKGVYINKVMPGSGAEKAGLKKGDYITGINGADVRSAPQLIELVARYHPGDKIAVDYHRSNKAATAEVTLQGLDEPSLAANNSESGTLFGSTLQTLSKAEADKLGIEGGVQVKKLGENALLKASGIRQGFVITSINDEQVDEVKDIERMLRTARGTIQIGGLYPGRNGMYYYGFTYPD